jgi:hypothetical protein
MTNTTRRGFLAAAGATTAAGVVAATVGGGQSHAAAANENVALPADVHGAMAAYVHDVRTGEVALMVEDREVVVKDKSLTAALARAFARASN